VYETVCALLNRHGGTILLGVQDDGFVEGIDPNAVERIRKDFVTAINNPQKLTPPTYLSIENIQIDGLTVLRVYIPESSQVHRCNGRIYDRNEDGDLDITDHTVQVALLYQRKAATYSENRFFPHLTIDDLNRELLAKCRKVATIRREDHPWKDLDDLELLKSAQLYQASPETGQFGITLAGILLLGNQLPLLNTVPHHRTDSTRELKGKISKERRFFITSSEANPSRQLDNIRSHWGIEATHWTIDVTFNEDSSRARIKNAQANLAILRKIARNILKADNTRKASVRIKRWAAMDQNFLMEILGQSTVLGE